jgi:hypothetical protein
VKLLKDPIAVDFNTLYPDPNNPRLAPENRPGYTDSAKLFDDKMREEFTHRLLKESHQLSDLIEAIAGQGWLPIDSMLVWEHPEAPGKYCVVEGNRRRTALQAIRTTVLPNLQAKVTRMKKNPQGYPVSEVEDAEEGLRRVVGIISDTDKLQVVPVNASTPDELEQVLHRVLPVRHIIGAKDWGNYAQDLWLLKRFESLFIEKHGSTYTLFWDDSLVKQVSHEASIGETVAKRKLKSAKWFAHFRAEWEDQLPDGEDFREEDHFLFENISKKPWVRERLGLNDNSLSIPEVGEKALFEWVFKEPRKGNRDSSENPNKFHAHRNILEWANMKEYDNKHGTSFASRYDVEQPESAPKFDVLLAEFNNRKLQRGATDILTELIERLEQLKAEELSTDKVVLPGLLERVRDLSDKFLNMARK